MISNHLIMHCLYVMNLWVSCQYSKATKPKNFSAGFQEKSFKKVEFMVSGANRGSVSMESMYSLLVI